MVPPLIKSHNIDLSTFVLELSNVVTTAQIPTIYYANGTTILRQQAIGSIFLSHLHHDEDINDLMTSRPPTNN